MPIGEHERPAISFWDGLYARSALVEPAFKLIFSPDQEQFAFSERDRQK